MRIDIVVDTICPWCFIGKRQLESVLASRPLIKPEIHWRPSMLNPNIPMEGVDYKEFYRSAFGGDQQYEMASAKIIEKGNEHGIPFNLEQISKVPNTMFAHSLIYLSKPMGIQNLIVEALFQGYFVEGKDMTDPVTLARIGGDYGMTPQDVLNQFRENVAAEPVMAEIQAAPQMGVNEVPGFIFNKKYIKMGGQDPFEFLQFFDSVVEEEKGGGGAPAGAQPPPQGTPPQP